MIDNAKKAVIHIAKAQTGMTDDEYRALLSRVDVESSKNLSQAGFDVVMKHFEKMGFKKKKSKKSKPGWIPKPSKKRLLGKIKALSDDMGLKKGYANGIARKMFGVDNVAWCDADQCRRVVAALMYHKKRLKAVRLKAEGERP